MGRVYGTADGPKYHVSSIPICRLEILLNAELKLASDKLPFIDKLKKLLRKINVPLEILLQMETWTWKKLAGGGGK